MRRRRGAARTARLLIALAAIALFGSSSAAQPADVVVTITQPHIPPTPNGDVFGRTLTVAATVTSVRQLSTVVASIGGRTLPLSFATSWSGTMETADLPSGPLTLIVTATDVTSVTGTAQLQLRHDNPPTVEYRSPLYNALARPDVRYWAGCRDDEGACRVSARGHSADGELRGVDSLADLDGQLVHFTISATDGIGQVTSVYQPVWVESSPRLSLVGSLPGLLLDIDGNRALVLNEVPPRTVQLVDRTTGVARVIYTEGETVYSGALTPNGQALFVTRAPGQTAELHEWRANAVVPLGRYEVDTLRVAGSWATWTVPQVSAPCCTPRTVVRRDLASGISIGIDAGTGFQGPFGPDVTAAGDVTFSQYVSNTHTEVFRYSGGAVTPLSALGGRSSAATRTDGINVVFGTALDAQLAGFGIDLLGPGGAEVLSSAWDAPGSVPVPPDPIRDFQAVNGWTAFTRNGTGGSLQAWTRSPAGVLRQVSAAGGGVRLDALRENGDVVFSVPQALGGGRFLATADGAPPIRIGSPLGTVEWLDGAWHVMVGPHLLRFTPSARSLLPEGATGPFFDLEVAILNPGSAPVAGQVTFFREDGTTATGTRTFAAHARTTIHVNDEAGMGAVATSTAVDSLNGSPLVVERTMSWDPAGYGGHSSSAVDGPRMRWYFAEGAQGFFDTFLLLANDGDIAAQAVLTFMVEDSTIPRTRELSLPPRQRVTVYAGAIGDLAGQSFSVLVEADRPISAERAMYFSGPRQWEGGHASTGVADAAVRWYHAEGATGPTFDTYVLLANPNAQPTPAFVRFLTDTGESIGYPVTLPPLSRVTINAKSVDSRLANASFGIAINADRPIVSERAMYWSALPGGPWVEAHNSFGVPVLGTKWGIAGGQVGGPRGHQTYVLIANPSEISPATVRLTFMRDDGVEVQRLMTLGTTSRASVFANAIPQLAEAAFGVVVESTNGTPVAVERATYWNAGGMTWAAGTNVTATRLP